MKAKLTYLTASNNAKKMVNSPNFIKENDKKRGT